MDILSTIFDSEVRVRMMRLFLFNPENIFDIEMISLKTKTSEKDVKKELIILSKSKLIKKQNFVKTIKAKNKKHKKNDEKETEIQVKSHGYILDQDFPYITALKQLLIKTKTLEAGEIVKRLSRSGKIKLIIVSGVFIQDKDSRVDVFVVGNNINKNILNNSIKSIEAELGKELTYAFFETADFQYRLGMYDKLIRDVLDYPHQVLLDKISL
jgi:hypothetical protein